MYVIYQNNPDKKIRIHKADCPFARSPGYETQDGQWHGPYETFQQAETAQTILAGQMGAQTIDTCGHCM